jgi:4-amino-4-deoxy-L-arabinose transferase-like glycosyltransferase
MTALGRPFDLFRPAARSDPASPPGGGLLAPLLAALVVLLSALPGLVLIPPLDRDESRFAQASAQMLETGDLVDIRYQAEPRDKKPVGIHWLQAMSVAAVSSVEARRIWAYRLPSLIGAMTAAAACAAGAGVFWGARGGLVAGALLGASLLLASEAFIAKTDAVLCGAVTVAMAALGGVYAAARSGRAPPRGLRAAFWAAQGVAILDKGPIGPMTAGLALLALAVADRDGRWIRRLGWGWGLILVALIVGPWAAAITVSTDGGFWTGAVGGDLAPKLAGGHETHGAPPGLHALLLPLLFFPGAFILPAAGVAAWRGRRSPGVRFALAWLLPAWAVFEATPTKLVHYTLPLYGAVAFLAAAALCPAQGGAEAAGRPFGPWTRASGAALSLLGGGLLAAAAVILALRYGDAGALGAAVVAALIALAAGAVPGGLILARRPELAFAAAVVLGVAAHSLLVGALAPRLAALFTSARAAAALKADGLDPRGGVVTGPVGVVGYAEPSLVFALGTGTEIDNADDGAESLGDGQPVFVEGRQEAAFRAALAARRLAAVKVDEVAGFDYSSGKPVRLGLWRAAPAPHAGDPPP